MMRAVSFLRRLGRAFRREDGNATAEFALLFPLFMVVFFTIFEMALLMTRYMMFERAVDIVVREMRLSSTGNYTHDQMRDRICQETLIVSECNDELVLEMRRLAQGVNTGNWSFPGANENCVNRVDPSETVKDFTPGQENDIMYLRACLEVVPFLPGTGLGAALAPGANGVFYMIAQSAYSVEPL